MAMPIFFSLLAWHLAEMCLCKLAGLYGIVAAYVAFSVTALIHTMLCGCCTIR